MRKRRMWLLAVLLGAAVAGCTSSSDAPGPTITSTYQPPTHSMAPPSTPPAISTGPNVRPGEKPPTLDPVGKANTAAGALAFADYWMRTLDWGYATTDSSLAKGAFSPVCTDCARFMKIFDDARANGVHFLGGRMDVIRTEVEPVDHRHGATAVVDVTVSIEALRAVDSSGHVVESGAASPQVTYRVWLQWLATRWTVVDWKQGIAK